MLEDLQLGLRAESFEDVHQAIYHRLGASGRGVECIVAAFRLVVCPRIVREGSFVAVPHRDWIAPAV